MATLPILLSHLLTAMLLLDMQLLGGLYLQYSVSDGLFKVEAAAQHIATNIMRVFMISN